MSEARSECIEAGQLNSHGDVLIPTTGFHGADIASQRIDDLDRAALHCALSIGATRGNVVAVDVGAGLGAQTARFAALGLSVLMIDLVDRSNLVKSLDALYGAGRVTPIAGDVRRLTEHDLPSEIHLVYSQRTIHYMRNEEAVAVLRLLRSRMTPDARLFLSCACVESELTEGYSGLERPIQERFGPLSQTMAQKHNIMESLSLYSRAEFVQLAEASGFSGLEVWQSAFGTLKGVFEPSNQRYRP